MKFFGSLILLALVVLAVDAYVPPIQKPNPNQKPFPTFPGQGPFNPRPHRSWRFRRSPEDDPPISVQVSKGEDGTSWRVEGQRKVWENEHGNIHVSGGASQYPGGKTQGNIGLGGTVYWG